MPFLQAPPLNFSPRGLSLPFPPPPHYWHSSPWNKVSTPFSHFKILFWESCNTCPLIACQSASVPSWQGCLLWLMMWLMDKIRKNTQKNISVWSGVSASLHQVAAEGIFCCMPHYTVMAFPGKAVSFHDTRQQAALWTLGLPRLEERGTKEWSFPKTPQVAFLLSWI